MCKRTFSFMLLISAVVIVSGTVWTQAGDGGARASLGFGQRIAGTYVAPTGFFGPGALMLHADGTLAAASGTCCGAAGDDSIQSEAMGNWVRTGSRQIEVTALVIATIYDLDTALPDHNSACMVSERLDFESDFQSYTGVLATACWNSSDEGWANVPTDLLNPDRDPDICTLELFGEIPVSGARLPAAYPVCGELP